MTILARGSAEIIALLLNAAVVIVATRAVGPTAFGTFAVAAVVGQIGVILANSGMSTFGSQAVANLGSVEEIDRTDSTRIWSTVVGARLVTAASVVVLATVGTVLFVEDHQLRVLLLVIVPFLLFVPFKSEWMLVALGKAQFVALTRVLGSLATALIVLGTVRDETDVVLLSTIFVAPIVVSSLVGTAVAVTTGFITPSTAHRPSLSEIRSTLRLGSAYLRAETAGFVYASSDRFFLYAFAGPTVVGLYEAAYKLLMPFYAIRSVIGDSMYGQLARSFGRDGFHATFRRWVDLMCVATVPVGLAATAFSPWIISALYGQAFDGAAPMLAVLGWAITLGYLAGVITIPFTAWNAGQQYGRSVVAGGAANIALNLMLIPSFGGVGAALATVGATVAVGVVGYPTFRRLTHYPIARQFAAYGTASALAFLIGAGAGLLGPIPAQFRFALACATYAAIVAWWYWKSDRLSWPASRVPPAVHS